MAERELRLETSSAVTGVTVTGLLGAHPRIVSRSLSLELDETIERLTGFVEGRAPRFRAYRELRLKVAARERARLRVDEFSPRVLTSFVRNRLIDQVYLPLIGANLAKQIGAAGAKKRTDLMGLLLLVSPPGYGKTTLMEYVASRLGLVFMKVNGPALGSRRPLARSERGAQPDGQARGRQDQPRARDGQQRDALPRRHPAHAPRALAEVHLAVRRAATRRGRVERKDPDLRSPRQEVLRGDGGQPVHRVRRALPDPGHAREPRRHVQPGRHPGGQVRQLRAELHRERAHLERARSRRSRRAIRRRATSSSRWRSGEDVATSELSARLLRGRDRGVRRAISAPVQGTGEPAPGESGVHRVGLAGRQLPHRAAPSSSRAATAT